MAGRFVISADGGRFRFALVAPNGQTLAVGEGFTSRAACVNGIEAVRRHAPGARIDAAALDAAALDAAALDAAAAFDDAAFGDAPNPG